MEHALAAPHDGVVRALTAKAGDTVQQGQRLMSSSRNSCAKIYQLKRRPNSIPLSCIFDWSLQHDWSASPNEPCRLDAPRENAKFTGRAAEEDVEVKSYQIIEFGRPLRAAELADPVPTGHEVVVAVQAAGVCHSDLHIWEGATISAMARS